MSQYFVVDTTTGQKYGPADMPTLNDWAQQGRVTPQTVLEDSATGNQIPASSVPGLLLPGFNAPSPSAAAPSAPPSSTETQTNYQPYQPPTGVAPGPAGFERAPVPGAGFVTQDSQKLVTNAWIWFAVGFLCCGLIGYPMAIVTGNKALEAGNEGGKLPKTLSIVFIVLSVVAVLLYFVLIGVAVASGGAPTPT
jgi:hypothetical protein